MANINLLLAANAVDIVVWVIIGLVAAVAIAAIVYVVIKIAQLKPEEREELVVQFLIGLVSKAEEMFDGKGRGKEKLEWVEQQFNAKAPWFIKTICKLTRTKNLCDLVEKALVKAKALTWDKDKNKD